MPAEEWRLVCERAREFVIACARQRRTTTYGELSDVLAPAPVPPYGYAMTALLNEIGAPEDLARGVVLASLVCTKATGVPGEGYFASSRTSPGGEPDRRASWEADVERVFAAFAE